MQRSESKTKPRKSEPPRRWAVALIALLSIVGLGVSTELTLIHYRTHTDPTFRSVCAVSESINCETVAQSPYSVFLGVPVSVWGLLGYGLMATLALWGASRRRLHPGWPRGGLLTMAAVFLGVSAALGTISVTKIDAICLFCFSSYGINAAVLVLAWLAAARTETGSLGAVWQDLRTAASKPLWPILLGLATVGVAAAMIAFYPTYWHHVGWSDLPALPKGATADGLHWIGARKPTLVIEEFSDYECPHCRRAHKHIRAMAARYPNKARLIHRHFPLDNACNPIIPTAFHERACEFAIAAECAGEQGRFWEMNDALFSVQDTVKAKDVDVYRLCVQLGLDASQFKRCLSGEQAKAKLATDITEGTKREIQGTPTFFIDDHPFAGAVPDELFETRLGTAAPSP